MSEPQMAANRTTENAHDVSLGLGDPPNLSPRLSAGMPLLGGCSENRARRVRRQPPTSPACSADLVFQSTQRTIPPSTQSAAPLVDEACCEQASTIMLATASVVEKRLSRVAERSA